MMKFFPDMKKVFPAIKKLFIVLVFTTHTGTLFSQTQVEVFAGVGFTGVDVEKWYGGSVEDWFTMMGEAYVAAYPFHFGGLSLGAEIGYQYFFWYTVPVFGYSWVYEYEVDAIRIMPVVRTRIKDQAFAEFGPGAFIISDWVSFGIMASVGYEFQISEKLSVPVKFRAEYVAGDNMAVIGLNGGISYSF